jgi:hypothetical protein
MAVVRREASCSTWRHGGAVDKGRQGRDPVDAVVVPDICGQRRPASTPRARLQSRQFPAHLGDTGADQGVVADQPEGEADQDRRKARQSRPLCRFPDGRGRRVEDDVRRDSAVDCRTAAAATTSVGVNGPFVMSSSKNHGRGAS